MLFFFFFSKRIFFGSVYLNLNDILFVLFLVINLFFLLLSILFLLTRLVRSFRVVFSVHT